MCTWKKGMVLSLLFLTLPVSEDKAQCKPEELLKQELGYTQGCAAVVETKRENRGKEDSIPVNQLQWPKLLAFPEPCI